MLPRTISVGPIAAAVAAGITAAHALAAAGALPLNGSLATGFVANNIALSQAVGAAGPLLLNGALVNALTGRAQLVLNPGPVAITSAGNDSALTFTVFGVDMSGGGQVEVIKGANAGVAAGVRKFLQVISVTASGATAGNVQVGAMPAVILDAPRPIILTSSGNDSALNITISGTDWAGTPISETIPGGNGATLAVSALAYQTVTSIVLSGATAGTISAGTNGTAISQWMRLDDWALSGLAGQCVPAGTVNYTVQVSSDDPNSPSNPVAPGLCVWDSDYAGVNGAAAEAQFGIGNTPSWMRLFLNSGTGSVRLTVVQHGNAPY